MQVKPILVNEKQAAEMLGLSPTTLRHWRWLGKGPRALSISHRCVRYRVADLESWVECYAAEGIS